MRSLNDKSSRAGLMGLRQSVKWRLLEPAENRALGISSMMAEYDADLDGCVAASRQALRGLDFVVTGGELHPTEARIDARSELADLVRITLRVGESAATTRVIFEAGREWSHEGQELVRKLKDAFERSLRAPTEGKP